MSRRKQEINIYRIADEAGVSIATVSRVMNRRTGVSEATRSRIGALLRQYEFTPDYPEMRSPRIALLVPWDDISEYFRRIIKGACSYATEHNLEINIMVKSGRSEESMLARIRDQQCAGVIVALGSEFCQSRTELVASELPCVFLDTTLEDGNLGYIDNDSYSGSLAAARHLIELGHRRIGYLKYGDGIPNHCQRFQGYCDAMQKAGLPIRPEWIVSDNARGGLESKGLIGKLNMEKLLHQAPDVTAVMAVDDLMAMGAMTSIHLAGWRIPQDISIIGFDNMASTENWFPALTTVDHPLEEAGYRATQAIGEAVKTPSGAPMPRQTLPTRLIIRSSTGPVKT